MTTTTQEPTRADWIRRLENFLLEECQHLRIIRQAPDASWHLYYNRARFCNMIVEYRENITRGGTQYPAEVYLPAPRTWADTWAALTDESPEDYDEENE